MNPKKNSTNYMLCILCICIQINGTTQHLPLSSFESSYLYTGTYPGTLTNSWMDDNMEVQGVTNDGNAWFFTFTTANNFLENDGPDSGWLRRIIKNGVDLDGGLPPGASQVIDLNDIKSELPSGNFWHWGDPDHYEYDGEDYILVPAYGEGSQRIIICFSASPFSYVNFSYVDEIHGGWCAIGKNGKLYGSDNFADSLYELYIDWEILVNSSNHYAIPNDSIQEIALSFMGLNYSELRHMQGGEFSESGEQLYLVSGSAGCLWFMNDPETSDGIHVFRTDNWSELEFSIFNESEFTPTDYFRYDVDNNCACLVFGSQSPEGLTIWDIEDGSSPNIRGSLHVLVAHYNIATCPDQLSFKHYSKFLFVNGNSGYTPQTSPLTGNSSRPFEQFNEAFFYYPAWNGVHIKIEAGTYNETGFYNQRVKLSSQNGTVIIGQ